MKQLHLRIALVATAAAAAALLAGCGGGGGDDGGTTTNNGGGGGTTTPVSEVPSSAQQSIAGLIAYVNDLIANRTDSTSEPVVLGDAVLPTSDTSEPL